MQFLTALGGNLRKKLLAMTPDILLIGTGITSALTANFLQKLVPAANIIIWDKARGVGGRMSRSTCPEVESSIADLGAQYITTNTETMKKYEEVYGSLMKAGLIEEMTAAAVGMKKFAENVRHFVAPNGMNSVVKHFLREIPKENILFSSRVVAIDELNGKFAVQSEVGSRSVDVVVSTMPVPQFLELSGSVKNCIEKKRIDLEKVKYSSRFVLVLFYEKSVNFPVTDWALRYMDDEIFRYVSIDNFKRNRPSEPVSVIFHTSVRFGLENLEKTLPEMKEILLNHAKEAFPDWPEPTAAKCHKWRFSQVTEPFEGKPGCLLLNQNPSLILSGDAFSESTFDGCLYSAVKTVETVRQNLPSF